MNNGISRVSPGLAERSQRQGFGGMIPIRKLRSIPRIELVSLVTHTAPIAATEWSQQDDACIGHVIEIKVH